MRSVRSVSLLGFASALAVIALSACGGGGGSAALPAGGEPESVPSGSGAGSDSVSGSGSGSGSESADAAPAPTVPVPAALAALPAVNLTAPGANGVGPSPSFSWDAVPGATQYRLSVSRPDGTVVWAWQGADTAVMLGGYDAEPGAGFAAVRLTEPAWWSVVAVHDSGALVAVSPKRAVSPDDRSVDMPGGAPVSVAPAAIDPTTLDPCTLLSAAEVSAALGGEIAEPEASSGSGGDYRDCTWRLVADEFTEVRVAINNDPASFDPAGWSTGEIVVVDGLGEQSYVSTDFGVRIGFLRAGVAASVVAPVDPATAPTWVEIARLVDARLIGTTPMP